MMDQRLLVKGFHVPWRKMDGEIIQTLIQNHHMYVCINVIVVNA